ncbi:MAG: heparin lyase I family protein [Cyclobacteriaceae bacterium]
MKIVLVTLTLCVILFSGCKKDEQSNDCKSRGDTLETFISPEGKEFYLFKDGTAFVNNNGSCEFVIQYFDPDFLSKSYKIDATGKFLITDGGLFPIKNEYTDNFEKYPKFSDLFLKSIADKDLYWSGFTLLSPAAPTISDYVALRSCILGGTCTFIDNKIELAMDPMDNANKVLKFTSVAPTANMITAKASIESTINFFDKGSDLWFQASYYVESGIPFSLADFENSYFDSGPGPRVVIRDSKLSIENKFGAKKEYFQLSPITIPSKQWFTVKVHFKFSNDAEGVIELWQDGKKVISAKGMNLPTANSIQNSVELGITSTSIDCVLLMDNIKISALPF